nr:threonine/serine exporter family protein [uncultured Cetobacterium sp.]
MIFVDTFFSFFITASFAILFKVKGMLIIYSAIGGSISAFVYLYLMEQSFSYSISYLIATAVTALYSEIMAKKLKTTVPTLLVSALIRLAPGSGVYYTMLYFIQNKYNDAFLKGMETSIIAGSMALGIIFVSTLFRVFNYKSQK